MCLPVGQLHPGTRAANGLVGGTAAAGPRNPLPGAQGGGWGLPELEETSSETETSVSPGLSEVSSAGLSGGAGPSHSARQQASGTRFG